MTVIDNLAAAITEVRAEITRSDTKAGSLTAVATLLLSAGTAALVAVPLPLPARVVGWAGAAVLAASVAALVLALRPRLDRARGSWLLLATSTPANIAVRYEQLSVVALDQAAQLRALAGMGRAKYRWLRAASDLLLVGLAAAVAAAVLALVG